MKYLILIILLTSCITGASITNIEETGEPIEVYFCPKDNCSEIFYNYLVTSKRKDCAFYDLDDELIIKGLENSRIYMEEDNRHKISDKEDGRSSYMHNKFCILDNGVLTGSMNPTERGTRKNYNNIIFIPSPTIKKNYEKAFEQLWNGKRAKAKYPMVRYNGEKIRTAFCPEDDCLGIMMEELEKAKHNIDFFTFSFTHPEITDKLIEKSKQGIDVKGKMEGQRINMRWNQYNRLVSGGIKIELEETGATYHHKVFIIDNKTIITGSANPTRSGYNRNDENIIVLESPHLSAEYLKI